MSQNSGKCRIKEHQQYNAQMICTREYCDQISRYLCSQCITQNLHRHNKGNSDHIMDLKNLCNSILTMIKQYKLDSNLVEDWKGQFREFDKILGTHDHNSISQTGVFQYEYACQIKKKKPLKIFTDIEKVLENMCYPHICVKCFNDEAHDHKEILDELESDEGLIKEENTDLFMVIFIFHSQMKQWFKKPKYNQEKIHKIEQIFLSRDPIDYEWLIKLIFIKNRTFDKQRFFRTLLISINKLLKLDERDFQLWNDFQIKYDSQQSKDKTYLYELKREFPQFVVSSNEKDYVLQDKNKTLVFGDLLSQQIKQIQVLNKTIRIMKYSKDLNYFFCSDDQGYLLCYKTKNYKQMANLKLYQREITGFLPIENNEIISFTDGVLKIVNFINQKIVIQIFFEEVQFQLYNDYLIQMNDRQNCIEYDEMKQLIFFGETRIQMRHRKKLSLQDCSQEIDQIYQQLQLIQNKTSLLSAHPNALQLWKFDDGILDCIQIKEYDNECYALKFYASDNNNRIIVMGKCFFEILDYNFNRINIGNFDCHPSQFKIIGRKFQIEKQNSCYIILISENQIEVQKRVLCL